MVNDLPSGQEWIIVPDSTVVIAAMYDDAAERIYVRTQWGLVYAFDHCTSMDWSLFLVPGTSPGEYYERVLKKHPYTVRGRP